MRYNHLAWLHTIWFVDTCVLHTDMPTHLYTSACIFENAYTRRLVLLVHETRENIILTECKQQQHLNPRRPLLTAPDITSIQSVSWHYRAFQALIHDIYTLYNCIQCLSKIYIYISLTFRHMRWSQSLPAQQPSTSKAFTSTSVWNFRFTRDVPTVRAIDWRRGLASFNLSSRMKSSSFLFFFSLEHEKSLATSGKGIVNQCSCIITTTTIRFLDFFSITLRNLFSITFRGNSRPARFACLLMCFYSFSVDQFHRLIIQARAFFAHPLAGYSRRGSPKDRHRGERMRTGERKEGVIPNW